MRKAGEHILFLYARSRKNYLFDLVTRAESMVIKEFNSHFKIHNYPENLSYEDLIKYDLRNKINIAICLNFETHFVEPLINNCPNLHWIHSLGTGVENLLKYPALSENNKILLTNSKATAGPLLSEFAMLGCLYFAKNLRRYIDSADKGIYIKSNRLDNVDPIEGKTILIVGFGGIGVQVGQKAKFGFGMKVIGIKRDITKDKENLMKIADKIGTLEEIEDFIGEADYVVNSLPHVGKYVFTEKLFLKMKENSVFVSIGRGSAVDEKALTNALRSGKLKGAALDVFEKEPLPKDSIWYSDEILRKKSLLTCHLMDSSFAYSDNVNQFLKKNLLNYINGRSIENIVDKKLKY